MRLCSHQQQSQIPPASQTFKRFQSKPSSKCLTTEKRLLSLSFAYTAVNFVSEEDLAAFARIIQVSETQIQGLSPCLVDLADHTSSSLCVTFPLPSPAKRLCHLRRWTACLQAAKCGPVAPCLLTWRSQARLWGAIRCSAAPLAPTASERPPRAGSTGLARHHPIVLG